SKPPSSTRWAMSAWQFPSAEFGEPLKLQPQPGSQLQNSRYVPESVQSAIFLGARAYCSVAASPSWVQGPWPRTRSRRHDRSRAVDDADLVDLEPDPPAFQRVGVRLRKAGQRRFRGLQALERLE